MSKTYKVNGVNYPFPETGANGWGDAVTTWAGAVTDAIIPKAGGAFNITGELDFGPTAGLKTLYIKSRSTNPSGTGYFRLSNTDTIGFRNNANTADLLLAVTGTNKLQFANQTLLTDVVTTPASLDRSGDLLKSQADGLVTLRKLQTGIVSPQLLITQGTDSVILDFLGIKSVNGQTAGDVVINLDNIPVGAGGKQFYTDAKVNSLLATKTTDDIAEGNLSNRKYYSDTNVQSYLNVIKNLPNGPVFSGTDGRITTSQLPANAVVTGNDGLISASLIPPNSGGVAIYRDNGYSTGYTQSNGLATLTTRDVPGNFYSDDDPTVTYEHSRVYLNLTNLRTVLPHLANGLDYLTDGVSNKFYTDSKVAGYINSIKGVALGIPSLGSDGKVPSSQLPAVSATVQSVNLVTPNSSGDITLTSDQVVPGTNNRYYNQNTNFADFDIRWGNYKGIPNGIPNLDSSAKLLLSQFPALDTSIVAENSAHQYYTDSKVLALITAAKGAANGIATLDSTSHVPDSQIPAGFITTVNGVSPTGRDLTLVTSNIAESGNLYYTSARVQYEISLVKGVANGVATLDGSGKIPASQIPTGVGAVSSVAGRTGAVVITSSDLADFNSTVLGTVLSGYTAPAGTSLQTVNNADTSTTAIQKVVNNGTYLGNIVTALNSGLSNKVDKISGKGLSANDYDSASKAKVDAIDQVYSLTEKNQLATNTSNITNKVDKITGKGLSTNDYDTAAKSKVDAIDQVYSLTEKNQLATNSSTISSHTSTLSTHTTQIASKEPSLGNPATDGKALVSTAAGVRSWADLAATSVPESFVYGDGRDGDVTLGTSQTLNKNYYFKNLTIPAGVVINTGGYIIRCAVSAVINGNINRDGTSSTSSASIAAMPNTVLSGGGASGAGAVGAGGSAASAFNNAGGVGGNGAKTATGNAGLGATTNISATNGGVDCLAFFPNFFTTALLGSALNSRATGGNGGGGAGGDGTNSGMGGGQGGGVIVLAAKSLTGTGSITTNGGAGGSGLFGGGGGAGGLINIASKNDPVAAGLTITSNGGAAGTSSGTVVTAAQAGAAGTINILKV